MFVNLELFPSEKEKYYQIVEDIQSTSKNEMDKERRLADAEVKYKGQVRKYLPSALDVIKTVFGYQYSIYKVGKDFNASFEVIETNVRKTKSEIEAEMNQLKTEMAGMSLTEQQIHKVELAMDVLITYNEDAKDINDIKRDNYFNRAKVVASSIIEPVSRPEVTSNSQGNDSEAQPVAPTVSESSVSSNGTTADDEVGISIFDIGLSDSNSSGQQQDGR